MHNLSLFICIVLLLGSEKTIIARRTNITPKIDGKIEAVWYSDSSIKNFVQWETEEGTTPTESTEVYLLLTENAIYLAFKCFDTESENLDLKVVPRDDWATGDNVWIMLDTYGDKNTAYEFGVNAAGVQLDNRVLQDGRETDINWDGVWYSATKITDYGYNVEMKIPFKTIRFKPGLNEWGINFFRYISRKNEIVSWAPVKQSEGLRVSRSGILKNIYPGKPGLHLEIYPVALLRYEDNSIQPDIGLDLGWRFASSQLSLTTYPDFAQIEADPYAINLSKYEIFLAERRPFFIEGREVFDTPIELFYSRRIGKRLWTGEEVPIIGGAKYTGSSGRVNFGFLSAYTDEVKNEPRTLYSAGRISLGILDNSMIGLLYSDVRDGDEGQGVGGIDFTYRSPALQLQSQIAKEKGYAEFIKLDWYASNFVLLGKYESYDEDFDIDRIGFAPWKGRTRYYLSAGPRFFNLGPFRTLSTGVGGGRIRDVGEPGWEYWINGWFSPVFTNNWGFSSNFYKGKSYAIDRWYSYYQASVSLWSDYSKPITISYNGWYTSLGFNYRRWYFARMARNNIHLGWKINPSLSLSLGLSNTIEWKPDGAIEDVSWVLRPILQYALYRDIHLRIYAEPNMDTDVHQFNALLSYNFRPKSWFYLAFNETRDNKDGKMSPKDRIIVAKIRYLFFM